MKIVTWNINGIRTFKGGIKKALDLLDADIICFQETKVTRDLLDERTAVVDGYNSYFSFSRGRSGYSGVATFCKDRVAPFAAEEGLTGLLTSHDGSVGCYGDQSQFSMEELQMLDNEGRAVITQHKVMCQNQEKTLTVLNVYCPRADPEKPDRKLFKLQFYRMLQNRAEALLGAGSHVIVLGDVNTSHRPIDHCDPDDLESFEDNPGRKWLNNFLFGKAEGEGLEKEEGDREVGPESQEPGGCGGGKFVDTFRHFHPTRPNAFTCWSTLTGARQTNYGTRIDYIFADRPLAEEHFLSADIMPDVEGSDHCPVQGRLCCSPLQSPRCPPLCTRFMPEFAGRQQKLSRFLVQVGPQEQDALPGSQELGEIRENLRPPADAGSAARIGNMAGRKRGPTKETPAPRGKRIKTHNPPKPQGNLLAFFKPAASQGSRSCFVKGQDGSEDTGTQHSEGRARVQGGLSPPPDITKRGSVEGDGGAMEREGGAVEREGGAMEGEGGAVEGEGGAEPCPRGACPLGFWKAVLHGPPQPPLCKVHQEPCVLRTVRKAGPNMGRRFFVCCRPQGHASNPQARCNFFTWVDKGR
ncbi:DNA-(apurinic or apyrimidinic site) lyase 2 isoform X1 [Anguilla anguilla]|uniref:DNA-(apurinic or apyrimidinic site) lyase 2 isoform X1 n=2 Tax=Anguilla anguilla TaxID=7936 RepID=UPI0015A7B5BC|nr:DNA-(apurinic or apyrimidinic site) lyase 2 isoform X1 [Anguilla anguilla]